MTRLFSCIDNYENKYIDFWKSICLVESNSRDKNAINNVNDIIEKFSLSEGFSVNRVSFENAGDYMIVDMNKDSDKGCLFIAHTDTVFENGVFGEEIVKIKDGKMYGPGVIDCKGGIAMALLVMKVMSDIGYDKNLRLILVSDEEVDNSLSGSGVDVIKNYASGYKAAFCCEVGKVGEVLIGRKGILRYQLKIHGKAAHSGINYFDGINSVYEASKKIIAIQQLSKTDGATYSCNIINAGTVCNIIPDICEFCVDIRFKNYDEKDEVIANVKKIAETDYIGGTSCELIKLSERDPMLCTQSNIDLFNKIKSVADTYSLEKLTSAQNGGGSDAAYSVAVGVPTVCGIGTTGEYCHTAEEYANISSLAKRAKIIAAVIKDIN